AYHEAMALRLDGVVDVAALECSFDEVISRHETLRTRIVMVDGEGVQVVDPPGEFRLEVVDLSLLDAVARETRTQDLMRSHAVQPFDLKNGPLFGALLLRLTVEEHVVLVTMHHIVSDGWSMGVLRRELGMLYTAFSQGRPSPLPALAVQYADYALWQREWLQGAVLEQ